MGQPSPLFPNVIIFDHPLIQHKLSYLRDITTSHRPFRALLYQIAGLMVFEATRNLSTRRIEVQTPLERTTGSRLAGKVTVVPILRAGLGMAEGVLEMMPQARVGHLGIYRDESTLEPIAYLKRLPKDLDAGPCLLVDPMLATGGSAVKALDVLRAHGGDELAFVSIVSSPEGVAEVEQHHPQVPIFTAALDRALNAKKYILPGLGDFGDRLYGT